MSPRRLAALVAVPVLLFTAACGSDPESVAEVSGKVGAEPEISVPEKGEPSGELVVKTLVEGRGDVVKKGDFVRLSFTGQTWKDGRKLPGTWTEQPGADAKAPVRQAVELLGEQSANLPKNVLDEVVGQKAGSRVLVQGSVKDLIGGNLNPESGLKAADILVYVLDVAAGAKADRKDAADGEQAEPADGMPTVKAEPGKPAAITVPKGEKAPGGLKEQVLIKGKGPKVGAGQGLIGQYTGVGWEDGKKFDSSWDHGGAMAFQIGTGSVVPGWDKGLVGKRVGDRVLLVVPPEEGYGANPEHPLAGKTLVFAVDIIGTV